MVRARARSIGMVLAALVACLVLACTSPTLPLPPPAAPTISAGLAPDTFRLSAGPGSTEPNALVLIVNRNPEIPRDRRVFGTIADEQGAWELEIYARSGDFLDVSQESGATRSPPTTVQVR